MDSVLGPRLWAGTKVPPPPPPESTAANSISAGIMRCLSKAKIFLRHFLCLTQGSQKRERQKLAFPSKLLSFNLANKACREFPQMYREYNLSSLFHHLVPSTEMVLKYMCIF